MDFSIIILDSIMKIMRFQFVKRKFIKGKNLLSFNVFFRPLSDPLFSIEEPYSREIVPINLVHRDTLDEMIEEFKKARDHILDTLFDILPQRLAEEKEKNDES